MDKRVKERLTGALVLVAVIVILVPEMFGGRGNRPLAVDPAAGGSEGPPLRSFTIEVEPKEGQPPGAEVAAPPAARAAPPSLPPGAMPVPVPVPVPAPVAERARPAPAAVAEPARIAAPPAPQAAAGGWYVQLGVFAQRANAERYAQDVQGKGYEPHVDAIRSSAGKDLFRVRIGPVADRAAAAKVQARLGSDGFKGTLSGPT